MRSRTIDQPVTLLAPSPFSQEPMTLPPEFPTETLDALLARGYTRLDAPQPKTKTKKESE